jgi:hypothetical protein
LALHFPGSLKLKIKLQKASLYSNALEEVCRISKGGDPFIRYANKRVKSSAAHKPDQYFVYQNRAHYIDPSAAKVCEDAQMAYKEIDPEEEEVLFTALGNPWNALQMKSALDDLRNEPKR